MHRWIVCSDTNLPKEEDGRVLVTMPYGEVTTARYSEYSGSGLSAICAELGEDL